jgi:hypothetical protein
MKPIVISDISPAKYQFLLTKLRANKEILVKDNMIAFHGVELQTSYADNALTMDVVKHSLLITRGHIQEIVEDQLAEYVASAHLYPNTLPMDMSGFQKKQPDWFTQMQAAKKA